MGSGDAIAVEGGLADPVFDGQAIFRALMGAFAEPGTIADFGPRVTAPDPLLPAAAAILAALADGDTPIWMEDPAGSGDAAARWLRFQTGAPITSDVAAACYAILRDGDDPAGWTRFSRGTPDCPDRSATLILPVRCFSGGAPLVLAGPGIETSRIVSPLGLADGFVAAMAANQAGFPLGFDLVLVCGTAALALPRSTRIQET